jgi:hypothetical protein
LIQSEIEALTHLKALFPSLAHVSPGDEFGTNYESYGGSWESKPLSEVCDGGAGWDIHGILCGAGRNIAGIRFTNSWGDAEGLIPPLTMPYLKQFTVFTPQYLHNQVSCAELFRKLSTSALETLYVAVVVTTDFFPVDLVPTLHSLRNLTLYTNTPAHSIGLSDLLHLEYVSLPAIQNTNTPNFSFLAPLNATLQTFIAPSVAFYSCSGLDNLTKLEEVVFSIATLAPVPSLLLVPPSLLSLTVRYWPAAEFQVNSTTLLSLTVHALQHEFKEFRDFPASLRRLQVDSSIRSITWPVSLPSSLEDLALNVPRQLP